MKKNFLLAMAMLSIQNVRSQNEDFEDGSLTFPTPPASITVATPNAINGWTVNGGSNSVWGSTGNCTNTTAITGNPNACVLISPGSSGHIDPIIGASYPIFSVFGSTTTSYPIATVIQTPVFQCFGDWFIKLNNQTPGSSVNRLSKTINVTIANSLFNFAYMNVLEKGDCCCDNPGFSLKVKTMGPGCTGPSNYASCPQFTASAPPMSWCTPSAACVSNVNSSSYLNAAAFGWVFNKWQRATLDLTPFIGTCITIEVTAFDCPYNTHAGYTYFDALSGLNAMYVNNILCFLGVPNPTISVCGNSTTTLTAPPAAWGYTWTIPGPTIITGVQTITTNVIGNHTLTMAGPGLCSPIVKVINLINTPSPTLAVVSLTQASCTNSNNAIALSFTGGTPNSATTPNFNISFMPASPTTTLNVSANSGTYGGLSMGSNTITITDSVGCTAKNVITMITCGAAAVELEWSKNISIAPNPNNGKFNVLINANLENGEIRIVNAIGQEVYHQNIKQGKNEINVGVLAKGIYHYSILQNKQPVNRGKILIE